MDDVRSTAGRPMGPGEMGEYARSTEFDDELFSRMLSVVESGDEITTLSNKRPNRIVSIDRSGVSVETLRLDRRGTGPQIVPARMIVCRVGAPVPERRVDSPGAAQRAEREAFGFRVCVLAQFPDVVVRSTRPIVLELISR
jgi:hypothetical protein